MISHLFNSTAYIQRQSEAWVNGMPTRTWVDIPPTVRCRMDLHHRTLASKPERAVLEAATVPDLTGTMFMPANTDVRVGDHIKIVGGVHKGRIFSVDDTPAMASGYSQAHHLEWSVTEVSHV